MWQLGQSIDGVIYMGILLGCSAADIRFRRVPAAVLAMAAALGSFYVAVADREGWYLHLAGMAVGAGFLIVSRLTREALGYGDSFMILSLGIYLGVVRLAEMLFLSWILLAVAAMVCLIKKKWSRKASLPAIPFLTAGYAVLWIGELLS